MKLRKGVRGGARTSRDVAWIRSLGDAEQQTDHQIAPQQSAELLSKVGCTAIELGVLSAVLTRA
jgi:hypothetical protein